MDMEGVGKEQSKGSTYAGGGYAPSGGNAAGAAVSILESRVVEEEGSPSQRRLEGHGRSLGGIGLLSSRRSRFAIRPLYGPLEGATFDQVGEDDDDDDDDYNPDDDDDDDESDESDEGEADAGVSEIEDFDESVMIP
ncbi:hypothetical protein NLJ89_g12297 [Agrocybe chaxingu]|uniref:Uncharacterized protein n=1 Tax=Agrocybe chaxingu TaxID=84603 RepID=A0A9W8MP76_9AGAR|nr:hypothetical protein NLJ89_g12297 [Agrocybe chaxingu]